MSRFGNMPREFRRHSQLRDRAEEFREFARRQLPNFYLEYPSPGTEAQQLAFVEKELKEVLAKKYEGILTLLLISVVARVLAALIIKWMFSKTRNPVPGGFLPEELDTDE